VVVVLNTLDRADARPDDVIAELEHLFMDLATHEDHLDFPIVSAVSRTGRTRRGIGVPGPDDGLDALLDTIVAHVPPPRGDAGRPLQALVTNLDASDYLGRLAIGRVVNGVLRRGEPVALLQEDDVEGTTPAVRRLVQLMGFDGVGRVDVDAVGAGDLFIVAGYPEVEIGDTLADPQAPVALPRLTVDEPVLRMTFGVNTSPLAGRDGTYLTTRHLRERLEREVRGNVSIRIADTGSPDVIEVAGRGELQLAVLIEAMRREGYELEVSRPEVVVRDIGGRVHEPLERGTCDVPEGHVGTVTQALAPRKGRVVDLRPGDPGRTIVTFEAPARGLLGFRSLLMTATRGTALLHHHHAGWTPWAGELPHRTGGAMVADRLGEATAYALDNLQVRGEIFVSPGSLCYEGMVVGECARPVDLAVNVARAKEKTNMRTHSHDEQVRLAAPRVHTLESAIEHITDDELVEVTPAAIRLRKRLLGEADRRRVAKRAPTTV
jgi:GTP-binding protein